MAAGRIKWGKVADFVAKWLGEDIADGMILVYEKMQKRRQESTPPPDPPTGTQTGNLTGTLIHAVTSATTRTTSFTKEEFVAISALTLFVLGSLAYAHFYLEPVVVDVGEGGDDEDEEVEGPIQIGDAQDVAVSEGGVGGLRVIVQPCMRSVLGFSSRPACSLVSYSHRVDDAGHVAAHAAGSVASDAAGSVASDAADQVHCLILGLILCLLLATLRNGNGHRQNGDGLLRLRRRSN